jgi:bacterial/archaeal transporter family-2 protein
MSSSSEKGIIYNCIVQRKGGSPGMFIFISIIVGCFISLMIAANGQLQAFIGSSWSLIIIHIVGLTASLALVPLTGNRKDSSRKKPPAITFLAGSLGIIIIYLNNKIYLTGGVVLTLSGMLAGQSIAAAISDFVKAAKNGNKVSWKHLTALGMVVCGVMGIGFSSGVSLPWILLSWVPGGVLMLQILMNSSISGYYGQTRMLQISYSVGLAAIVIFAAFSDGLAGFSPKSLSGVPVLILLGGGLLGVTCMTGQNMLLRKISALQMVLGTYLGQFAMGVVMDMTSGKAFDLVYIIGLFLILSGLVLQNLEKK